MSVRTPLAAFVVMVTMTTACGDSSGSSAASEVPSAAEARAAADAINLRAADLPGFEVAPAEAEDPAARDADDPLLQCIGAGLDDGIVETVSPTFSQGQFPSAQVFSSVDVYADPARAAADITAYQGDKAVQCIGDFFKKSIAAGAPPGAAFDDPQVSRDTPAAPGTDASVEFQIVTALNLNGRKVPVTGRLLTYAKGHTQVALTVVQSGQAAPEVQTENIFQELVNRSSEAL